MTGPIHFFGNSLTEDGNLFELAQGLVAEPALLSYVGTDGRLSNGRTYAEYVDDLLGVPQGGNYALAGAEAVGTQRLGDFFTELGFTNALLVPETDPRLDLDTNLGAQVDRFAADMSGTPLGDATGFILAGSNDFLTITSPSDAPVVLAAAVQATLSAATDLLGLGMGEVVISTLPVPLFFPALGALDPTQAAQSIALSAAHTVGLRQGVEALQAQGQDVRLLDIQPITRALLEDPSGFGLIAPWSLTLETGAPDALAGYDDDQVAFWNPLHPTTATHGILGAYTAFALEHAPTELTNGSDVVATGRGADLVLGLQGDDVISLGRGNDLAFGGSGRDSILAGKGNDLVSGGSGSDLLIGQHGRDVLSGGEGSDWVFGNQGQDVLIDGLGSDRCWGGSGADQFIFTQAELIGGITGTDSDLFVGGSGTDTLWLVIDTDTASELGDELTGSDPQAALATLGLRIQGVEEVRVIEGRAGLATLTGETWYQEADIWGLV
ncbi:SGNH/GDSL hydrolase family protein [uncultured Paracoccus sp.]|uniref:SGNH/GDSL hydrolase family protein n=1 Tax=uncultured Paracoccus sp. TaxID=189685 RepID=UPI002608651D|nr:SGNH/GDSL hydrolase family protein [uncultured Paracoccus sp.]